jgi:hypothetical protein
MQGLLIFRGRILWMYELTIIILVNERRIVSATKRERDHRECMSVTFLNCKRRER